MQKRNRILYWVSTVWLCLGMTATGLVQLLHVPQEGQLSPPGAYGMAQLGYPPYFMTLLGAWKLLGVVALLLPRYALLKEWAYAGYFFLITGALWSHLAVGHALTDLLPALLLLALLIISWTTRPASRRTLPITQLPSAA